MQRPLCGHHASLRPTVLVKGHDPGITPLHCAGSPEVERGRQTCVVGQCHNFHAWQSRYRPDCMRSGAVVHNDYLPALPEHRHNVVYHLRVRMVGYHNAADRVGGGSFLFIHGSARPSPPCSRFSTTAALVFQSSPRT